MKFSTTSLVLAAVAVESVSAGTMRHAHKHVHEKKAEVKRDPYEWTPPANYDWHTDDGKKWNYNPATQNAGNAAATPASPAEVKPTPAAVPAAAKADVKDVVSDVVDDVKEGVAKLSGSAMGNLKSLISGANLNLKNTKNLPYLSAGTMKAGINAEAAGSEFAWLGASDDAAVVNTLVNESPEDITVALWALGGYTGMFLQKESPAIAVKIPSGQSIEISHGAQKGAWAPIYPDTAFAWNGLVHENFGEFNFGVDYATFDVSKIPANSGHPMTITDGTCTSSSKTNKCVYECTSFEDEKGGDWCLKNYHLTALEGVEGCHVGPDANLGGADGGGCMLKGKKITTTFH